MEDRHAGSMESRPTVLLAEDEAVVRQIAAAILQREGFRVRTAVDGREALDILQGPEGGTFDLLLTDMLMPRMGGEQLAREALRLRPDLPILFMSGHFEPVRTGPDIDDMAGNFLPKPFKPADLVEKARSLARKAVGSS